MKIIAVEHGSDTAEVRSWRCGMINGGDGEGGVWMSAISEEFWI